MLLLSCTTEFATKVLHWLITKLSNTPDAQSMPLARILLLMQHYDCYLLSISFTKFLVAGIQIISMIISFVISLKSTPWGCLRYSWIVISLKTDWVVSKTVSCSVPCSAVDFNGFYVTCSFSMGIAFWDYPSIPTWSVWFRHSKTVPISGFGYETDLLDTHNGKPLI